MFPVAHIGKCNYVAKPKKNEAGNTPTEEQKLQKEKNQRIIEVMKINKKQNKTTPPPKQKQHERSDIISHFHSFPHAPFHGERAKVPSPSSTG